MPSHPANMTCDTRWPLPSRARSLSNDSSRYESVSSGYGTPAVYEWYTRVPTALSAQFQSAGAVAVDERQLAGRTNEAIPSFKRRRPAEHGLVVGQLMAAVRTGKGWRSRRRRFRDDRRSDVPSRHDSPAQQEQETFPAESGYFGRFDADHVSKRPILLRRSRSETRSRQTHVFSVA